MPRRCGFTRSLAQAPPRLESPKQDSFQIESTLPCKVRWGPAQGCLPLMGKDVDFLPAGNVERGARGQELEAGPCQALAALAPQHDTQLGAQVGQMQDVAGGIGELVRTQRRGAPARRLQLGQTDWRERKCEA